MHGLTFEGLGRIDYHDDLPDPIIEDPTDVLIAVTRAGLCGSDLHPYEGREAARHGVVPGHEAVGVIISTGDDVVRFHEGDRVLVPFTTNCGLCHACQAGLSARCERGQLFGWGDPHDLTRPALHGGQATQLRVPLADSTLVHVPETVSDEAAVLLTDNLPTGWFASERSDPVINEAAMVVGLGSVGLSAVVALRALGAAPVFAVDPVDDRRQIAGELGAEPLDPAVAQGVTASSVVEAAGTTSAQQFAFAATRPGGTLSVIAVQTETGFPFTPIQAYDSNATLRFGRAPVRSVLSRIMPMIESGGLSIPTDLLVTHPGEPLAAGPDLYRSFAARQPGTVKVLFAP